MRKLERVRDFIDIERIIQGSALREDARNITSDIIEVAKPIGLYTSCEVSAPCGLYPADGIIGLLDVPGTFLNPGRKNAGLM